MKKFAAVCYLIAMLKTKDQPGDTMSLGPTELILILLIIVLLFGASKLPELGKSLGKGIKEFKDATTKDEKKETEDTKEKDSK